MMHEGEEEQDISLVLGGPDAPVHIARHVEEQVVDIPLAPPGIPPCPLQDRDLCIQQPGLLNPWRSTVYSPAPRLSIVHCT